MFDIFIANPDRHEGNLKTDDPDQPTIVQLFDHDHALFGHNKGQGSARLDKVRQGSLGLFSGLKNNNDFHKLAAHISTSDHFHHWIQRISVVSDLAIHDTVDEARDLGISASEIADCKEFLCERKRSLGDVLKRHRSFFPQITDWGLF